MDRAAFSLSLNKREIECIDALLFELELAVKGLPLDQTILLSKLASDSIPHRIRERAYLFKHQEAGTVFVVHGYPIDQTSIGNTPSSISSRSTNFQPTRIELLHMMFSSLVGEVFTWSSIQEGNLVNEVVPIKSHRGRPISSGADHYLEFHTEDAFHDLAGEFVGLMCLRNPTATPITLVDLDSLRLDKNSKNILFEERFYIGVNIAHKTSEQKNLRSVLFGDFDDPYIRINFNNMRTADGDQEAEQALVKLRSEMERKKYSFKPTSGDIIFLDNFKLAHAREPFDPRYDGTDRWLKRLYITNDLRKSRSLRDSRSSRILSITEQPD